MKNDDSGSNQNINQRIETWLTAVVGADWREHKEERATRFLEEAIELCQTLGVTKEQINIMLDYVYARPSGTLTEELTGVYVTLNALTSSHNMELVPAVEKQFEYYESRVAEYQKHRDNKLRFKGA